MQRAPWFAVAVVLLASCGGSQKVEPEPAPVEVVEEPVVAEPGPTQQEICESLCERVTQCAAELNPDTPAEEEVAQYRSDCLADVCERSDLTREQACLDGDGAECGTFFQCLQEIDTAVDPAEGASAADEGSEEGA